MGLSILIVDDNIDVRARLVELLRQVTGVGTIGEADSLAAARRALAIRIPDLLILDLQLPDGSGIDFLREFRGDGLPSLSIVLTHYSLSVYRRACLDLGASYFLDKATEFERVAELAASLARARGDV